jgi:hypothetical protein
MGLPRRADTALAHDLYPTRPCNDPGDSSQDNQLVASQTDNGEDREVNDDYLVEMLQAVVARKLRELGD